MIRHLLILATLLTAASSVADEQEEFSSTATISETLELKLESKSGKCQATAATDYLQYGTEAQVDISIDTEDCAVARGNYVVLLMIRTGKDNDPQMLSFEESWERTDDVPIESIRRYPIGDDVDLVRVRIRKLSCTCDAGN